MWRSLLLLALVACKRSGTETGDTDATDTDDTEDTDVVVPCAEFTFGGTLEIPDDAVAPTGEVTVGLFPFSFESDPTWTTTYATTTLTMPSAGGSTPYAFCMPAVPAEEWLEPLDDTDSGRAALFFVGAWLDADADATFDDGETLVGGTFTFVAYVEGPIPAEIDAIGVEEGWNYLYFDILDMDAGPSSATPFQSGSTALPVAGNLLLNDRASITGVVGPSGLGNAEVGLVSGYEMLDIPAPTELLLSSVTVDVTAPGASFALPVSDPPSDHISSATDQGGAEVAMYYAIAWEDLDDDGAYDETEPVMAHSLAAGAASRVVAWIHPTDFSAIFFAELFGGVGWQALEVTEADMPPEAADWDAGLVLGDQF
jgi:hypothetical protein